MSAALGRDPLQEWLGLVLWLVNARSGSLEGEGRRRELVCWRGELLPPSPALRSSASFLPHNRCH